MEKSSSGYLLFEHLRLFQKIDTKPLLGNLTSAEFLLLGLIHYQKKPFLADADAAHIADLIAGSKVTAQAISKSLNHLEDKGLIRRLTSREDRRTVGVCLTPKGEDCYLACEQAASRFLSEIKAKMGEENILQMLSLMEEFHRVAEAELAALKNPSPLKSEKPADDDDTGASPKKDTDGPLPLS